MTVSIPLITNVPRESHSAKRPPADAIDPAAMPTSPTATTTATPLAKPGFIDALSRRAVLARLAAMPQARLTLRDGGTTTTFGHGSDTDPAATLTIHDPTLWRAVLTGGSLAVGRAYVAGAWDTDDLTATVRIFCRNRAALMGLDGGMAGVLRRIIDVPLALRKHTRRGAQRHIVAHYDLGNAFFRTFLDERMVYSSAYYRDDTTTLEDAQIAKIDVLLDRAGITAAHHLLEIGCGWGALAIRAAQRHGCRVTAITISPAQHAEATARVAAAGVADRVTIALCDWRDVTGQYDRVISCEMIEAIGRRHYAGFFAAIDRLLRDDGLAVLQAITIADAEYERASHETDFIKAHVFPGSCIPSLTAMVAAATRSSSLVLTGVMDFTAHYARTLRDWRTRFEANLPAVRALGYDAAFERLWRYYLCYCEGGFAERAIGVVHATWTKPGWRDTTPGLAVPT